MAAPRDPRLALEQMLDAITEIEQFTVGMSFDAYVGDRRTRRAVERSIEIISEASRSVPADLKARPRPARTAKQSPDCRIPSGNCRMPSEMR